MISEVQKENIRNEIRREIHSRSFFLFVQWVATLLEPTTIWKWNFHHEFICDLLQAETERIALGNPRTKHIIINVPFRSSKSLICSICYPLYNFIVHPTMSHINLSYSDNLSTDHSNKVMAVINHPKFQELYQWKFDDTQRSKTDFKLKQGGSRLSGGMTGTVLGRGADIIVMDDPNNTRRLSAVERHNSIKAWTDTVSTRLNDPMTGLFIVIQQRLHQNDISGYLLEKEPDNWNLVCLPAELNPNVSPAHLAEKYSADGLLWKERFSRDVLNNFRLVLGSVGYQQQLNQLTSPEEGNIIKKDWLHVIGMEQFNKLLETQTNQLTGAVKKQTVTWDFFIDSAQTEKKKNDPSGILIACKLNNCVYVRKVIEDRLQFPELIGLIKKTVATYGKESSKIYIEPKSNGIDIINTLRRETKFNVINLPSPTTDKETRLNSVAPIIESGRYYLIEDISNDLLIEQLTQFPNFSHDEFVDLTGYCITKYLKTNTFSYAMP